MDDEMYIQTGVFLVCDKGTIVVAFTATPKSENHHGITAGTIRDNTPLLNILPFGACAIGGYACVPLMPEWKNYPEEPFFIEDFQPLLLSSYCKCQRGGNIKVFATLAEAEGYLADLKNTRIDGISWLDKTIGFILTGGVKDFFGKSWHGMDLDATQSIGRGFRQGLYNTWDGIKSLGKAETWKGLGKLAAIGIVGFAGFPQNPIPPRTRLELCDSVFGTDYAQTHDAIIMGVAEVVDQKIINGTSNERYEAVGQIYAAVVEAVVGTKGTALAIKGATTGTKAALGAARFAKLTQTINKMRQALKFSRLKDAIKGLFRKKVIPPGTRRNKLGQLIDKKTGRYVKDPTSVKKVSYQRNMLERKKALLRDAHDPNSDLTPEARKFIIENKGNKVPPGYEVSHEKPLYTRTSNEGKAKLDKADNMKTQKETTHRNRHKVCGEQYHKYGPANNPKNAKE